MHVRPRTSEKGIVDDMIYSASSYLLLLWYPAHENRSQNLMRENYESNRKKSVDITT
jgi:hypothetical protein